ncbi:MAG: SDR family oxidoreductase [Bacteroidetes bacterium]|nr:SDR family oxidoreductase [Bacteroidota bacterium]
MIDQQSFVITGVSSFLGRAFVKTLSSNKSYKLFITSRSKFEFDIPSGSKDVLYLPGIDLTDEADVDRMTKEIDQFLPGKFHVINCLGHFPGYKTVAEIDIQTAKKVFDSNILALYSVACKLLPLMCERNGGHFIGFSTHTLYQHYPKMVAFSAAKSAVESLIKGIANEYLKKGIHANTISLATLQTEIEIKMKPKGDSKNWLNPDEVCKMVEDLILQPNQLMNGNVIHVYKHSDSYFNDSYFNRINS